MVEVIMSYKGVLPGNFSQFEPTDKHKQLASLQKATNGANYFMPIHNCCKDLGVEGKVGSIMTSNCVIVQGTNNSWKDINPPESDEVNGA